MNTYAMINRDIFERHELADGRAVWIQRTKIPGVRRAAWHVVTSGASWADAPDIVAAQDKMAAYGVLADILRADVLDLD